MVSLSIEAILEPEPKKEETVILTEKIKQHPISTNTRKKPKKMLTLPNGQKFEVFDETIETSKVRAFLKTGGRWKLVKKDDGTAELTIYHRFLKNPMKIRGRLL